MLFLGELQKLFESKFRVVTNRHPDLFSNLGVFNFPNVIGNFVLEFLVAYRDVEDLRGG